MARHIICNEKCRMKSNRVDHAYCVECYRKMDNLDNITHAFEFERYKYSDPETHSNPTWELNILGGLRRKSIENIFTNNCGYNLNARVWYAYFEMYKKWDDDWKKARK